MSFFNAQALPTIPSHAAFSSPTSPTTTYQPQPRLLSRGSIGSSLIGGQTDVEVEETPEMEEKRKEKEEMKVNRKVSTSHGASAPSDRFQTRTDPRSIDARLQIADLEISNASLLAVNRMLEATKAKQSEFRGRSTRSSCVSPVAMTSCRMLTLSLNVSLPSS